MTATSPLQTFRSYTRDLAQAMDRIDDAEYAAVAAAIVRAFEKGQTVFIAGNGGSAATASHMACDFAKTTLGHGAPTAGKRLRSIALSDNAPLLTAWGNDVCYDCVFAEQLRNLGNEHDLLVVISASGNSPNVLAALQTAREMGIETIAMLGFEGGKALALADFPLLVRSRDYGVIEDGHAIFMHALTEHLKGVVQGG